MSSSPDNTLSHDRAELEDVLGGRFPTRFRDQAMCEIPAWLGSDTRMQ